MVDYDLEAAVRKLAAASVAVEFPPGGTTRVVSDLAIRSLASELRAGAGNDPNAFARVKRGLELAALDSGLCPRRYLRNIGTLGLAGQARLLRARVGLAGLGGLGGTVAEILTRAGVGELVLVDPDVTSEDNLNRQLVVTEDNLGRSKIEAALGRLRRVNSATGFETHQVSGDRDSFSLIYSGAAVLVDALDSLPARFALEDAARDLGVPLVHGAIAGLSGQVTTIFPGDPGLEALYGASGANGAQGVEATVGNPSPTPAMIAAIEAQEVLKIVAGVGLPLRRKLLVLDAMSPYAAIIDL